MQEKTKSFISALAIAFLDNFGLSIVFILFAPLLLNPEYGFFSSQMSEGGENILLGILVGVFPLLTFFGAPFWGDVGDRFGRRKALLLTILGTVLGHLITALAIQIKSYTALLGARAIAGFFAGNVSLCLAVVSDVSSDAKLKARNFGLLSVFLGIGWILAMILGGYLSDPTLSKYFNPALPFFIAAILTFLGFILIYFLFQETHVPKKIHFSALKSIYEIYDSMKHPQMRFFLYILFIWSMGWFFDFQWFTPVSIEVFSILQEKISSSLFVLGISWVIGGVFLNSFLVKKFSSYTLSWSSILFISILIFFSSISRNYLLFSLFFWITALAAPISLSNLLNVISNSADLSIQGKVMGFSQSFQALAGFVVPFLGGILANITIKLIYPISAFLLFLSFFLLVWRKFSDFRSSST